MVFGNLGLAAVLLASAAVVAGTLLFVVLLLLLMFALASWMVRERMSSGSS